MAMTGMDIQQVRDLSRQMSSAAQQIRDIQTQLTNQLNNAAWVGPDQQRFVGDWSGTHVRNLASVAQALDSASQDAAANANQQEQAAS